MDIFVVKFVTFFRNRPKKDKKRSGMDHFLTQKSLTQFCLVIKCLCDIFCRLRISRCLTTTPHPIGGNGIVYFVYITLWSYSTQPFCYLMAVVRCDYTPIYNLPTAVSRLVPIIKTVTIKGVDECRCLLAQLLSLSDILPRYYAQTVQYLTLKKCR